MAIDFSLQQTLGTEKPQLVSKLRLCCLVGPPRVELGTNGLCLPTTAFAAPFEFVVWTVSCHYDLPVQSLHVLSNESFARDCHAA